MDKKKAIFVSTTSILLVVLVVTLLWLAKRHGMFDAPKTPLAKLRTHSKVFTPPHIEKVTDGVYVAVGYGLANAVMIEGDDGLIIVDTLGSVKSASIVKSLFQKIAGNKPVKAIIYTHNHPDHTFGAGVFAGNDNPDIISYATLPNELEKILNEIQPIMYVRSMRMFGTMLPTKDKINSGIGPAFSFQPNEAIAYRPPTQTFSNPSLQVTIAGVELDLEHAPGESNDQLFVWLPQKQVLLCGDNFYNAFPNLYSIRGTSPRDLQAWVASLDLMRRKPAAYLIPSHTNPITGEYKIQHALTNYRDAIQYVHDQTVRDMNAGMMPTQIAQQLTLPASLAKDPNLQQFYGSIDWSARGVFDNYLGWFSGQSKDLLPTTPRSQAQHMAELVGGVNTLVKKAKEAQNNGDEQWALTLADDVLILAPDNQAAKKIKITALTTLANNTENANLHNYLLTEALETAGEIKIIPPSRYMFDAAAIKAIPLQDFFNTFGTRLDPKKAAAKMLTIAFEFPDVKSTYMAQVRNSIVEIHPYAFAQPQATVTMSSDLGKQIIAGKVNLAQAYQTKAFTLTGDYNALVTFMGLFDPF